MPPSTAPSPSIIVVMGVSGSGKTTIGGRLADALRWPFLDADTLHSEASIESMRRGIALTDEARAPWLAAVRARILDAHRHGRPLVVACSALKAAYRGAMADGIPVTWVYLTGPPDLIRARLEDRPGHFMKARLLDSQYAALEEPSGAIVVDVTNGPGEIVRDVLAALDPRR